MYLQPDFDGNVDPFPFPFLPPSVGPGEGEKIRIEINLEWLQFVTGAATALCLARAWITEDEAAAMEIRAKAQDLLGVLNTPVVEPPFYESDDTADDEQLPDAPWYEDIADWIISAFLATTFTPGAAIVYKTTIPKLRLAFRVGNLGAIARVLLNDVEIWTGSTNNAVIGLLEQILDLESFANENNLGAAPWILKIVHGGAPLGLVARAGEESNLKLEVELGDVRPREATLQLRQNGCVIQSSDDGNIWSTIYDPTTCITGVVDGAIQDAIEAGQLGNPGSQGGPQQSPAPGQCRTYHVKLRGDNQWLCPSPLQAGDSVSVTGATGGWTDGSPAWYCPDGTTFGLGQCGPGGQGHTTGDPLNPAAYHMELIGSLNGIYFNAISAPYVVPAGTNASQLVMRANDASLTDNSGEIEFDVTVCTGQWCYQFDFAASNQSFAAVMNGGNALATYGSGGWNSVYNVQNLHTSEVRIKRTTSGQAYQVATVECFYNASTGPGGGLVAIGSNTFSLPAQPGGNNQHITVSPNLSGTGDFRFDLALANSGGATFKITKLIIRGLGVNPWGSDNCT